MNLSTKLDDLLSLRVLIISAIKKLMEKDIDDVGKIARNVKGKLEATTIDVILDLLQDFPIFIQFFLLEVHFNLKSSCMLMNFLLFRTYSIGIFLDVRREAPLTEQE